MTRKDYILIARAVARSRPPVTHKEMYAQWKSTATELSIALRNDSPAFDNKKFYAVTETY